MGRRARGTLPQMRLHKRSGTARVRVGRKEVSLGRFGDPETHKRYARFIVDYMRQDHLLPVEPEITPLQASPALPARDEPAREASDIPAPPTDDVPEGITVAEVCSQFLKFAEQQYRSGDGRATSTVDNTKMAIRALKEYQLLPAESFGPLTLQRLMHGMVGQLSRRKGPDGKPRPLHRTTINRTIKFIRRIFRWAASMELVPPSVPAALAHVELLRKGRTSLPESAGVHAVADEDIERTLPHLPSVVADMVRVQRLTGCRPTEICEMKPAEIDRSRDIWVWRPARHKTAYCGKARSICIGPKAQAVLAAYLEGRSAETPCFTAAESERDRNAARRRARKSPMTPSQSDRRERARRRTRKLKPYRRDSYGQAIERACLKAGVAKWSPNQLRHRAADEARNEMGLDAAQARLGHANAKITEVYAKVALEKAAEIARKMG
jgi:integrase